MGTVIRDSMGRRYELVGGKEGYRPPKQGEFYLGPTPTGRLVVSRALFDFSDTYPILRRLSIREQLPIEVGVNEPDHPWNTLTVRPAGGGDHLCSVGITRNRDATAPLDLDALKRFRDLLSELIAEAEASE